MALALDMYKTDHEEVSFVRDVGPDVGRDVLRSLVEVSWVAWSRNRKIAQRGLRIGLRGVRAHGIPPFLNLSTARPHIELAVFHERVGELALSEDAAALGNLLLAFHMVEGFVRPGMAMTTFLLHTAAKESPDIETVVMKKGGKGLKEYAVVRKDLLEALSIARRSGLGLRHLKALEKLMQSEDGPTGTKILDLRAVRNAIGHHDFTILDGAVLLRWAGNARDGKPGKTDRLSAWRLEETMLSLRGLVFVFWVWESMMASVFYPKKVPADMTPEGVVEILEGVETISHLMDRLLVIGGPQRPLIPRQSHRLSLADASKPES